MSSGAETPSVFTYEPSRAGAGWALDGEVLSLPSSPSSSPPAAQTAAEGPMERSNQRPKATGQLWVEDAALRGERLPSGEQVTLITESMSVTSGDQEKLLLLDRNTELRRVNKELMKLNEDWDQVYRSATLGLQQRLEALEMENLAVKELNGRLLLKVERQQAAKEYYEQALIQELKKNQDLHEYLRAMEGRGQHGDRGAAPPTQASLSAAVHSSVLCPDSDAPGGPVPPGSGGAGSALSQRPCLFRSASNSEASGSSGKSPNRGAPPGESRQELQDLKEQLEVLRYQTQIYEAEYQTEHNDHKHTLQENRRLRRKREEMRQQVALLQEQLRVYEDDFRRERSDKQVLQRLLRKTSPSKEPLLVHRCNNGPRPLGGDNATGSEQPLPHGKQHHPLCPKHSPDKETD